MYVELDTPLAAFDTIAAFDNGLLPLPTALDSQTNLFSSKQLESWIGQLALDICYRIVCS
jgi:hypothetical protein